jgi:hypothetical protein
VARHLLALQAQFFAWIQWWLGHQVLKLSAVSVSIQRRAFSLTLLLNADR